MNNEEKIKQAEYEGNVYFCPNCEQKQPVELTYFDPDNDDEADLLVCLVCKESIGFINNL